MKKFWYIVGLLAFCLSLISPSYAADSINKVISKSGIDKSVISVSIKNLKTGKTLYSLHQDRLINPASTQKLVTLAASLDTLGYDYRFLTLLYKSTNNDLYLKLGADPYLTADNLKSMFEKAKSKNIIEPKNIYIDDYILDSVTWGEGWQWDDDLNPLMPKFGAYNIDRNLIKVVIAPTTLNSPANVYPEVFYPITFMNLVTTGKENDIDISHNTTIANNVLQVEGSVAKLTGITIPVSNIKRYFRLRLEEAVSNANILFYGNLKQKKLPQNNIYIVAQTEHPIKNAAKDILQNSDNMIAETVFKLAGGKFKNNTGSINSALEMFNAFCEKNGLKADDVKLVDGSGVSKNNLMSADFMTSFLVAEAKQTNFETYKSLMASPGTGTLEDRMLYFKDNLKAKTGTLTDVSAIAGYIKTQRGNEYAFDIMINDHKSSPADKKMLEEYILRSVFANY